MITFVDNKGKKFSLPGSTTLPELVKMGIRHFELKPVDAPLKDNWYKNTP